MHFGGYFGDKTTIVWYVKANSTNTYIQCTIGKAQRWPTCTCVYSGFYPVGGGGGGGGAGGSFPPKHPNFSPKHSSFPPVSVACMLAVTYSLFDLTHKFQKLALRLHLWQCKIQKFSFRGRMPPDPPTMLSANTPCSFLPKPKILDRTLVINVYNSTTQTTH